MYSEFESSLHKKSNEEITALSKELDYYFGKEKSLILMEIEKRKVIERQEVKRQISINTSNRIELFVVIILGFGWFIFNSTIHLFSGHAGSEIALTDRGSYYITAYEVIVLIIIGFVLKYRGWKMLDFNLKLKFNMIFVAFLLLFLRGIIGNLLMTLFDNTDVDASQWESSKGVSLQANWMALWLIIVINSVYEEFLLIGYLFKRLEKYNPVIIITISMLIRFSFHTYQGWIAVVSIIPMGLVFGFYYYKFRRLWPLVIAHGLNNLFVFLSIYYQWSDKIENMKDGLALLWFQ